MQNDLLKQGNTSGWAKVAARLIAHVRTPLLLNGYALTLSATLTSGLGILYWALAANSYSAEVVGLNNALIYAMMFVSGVSNLNLMSVMIRFLPRAGRETGKLVAWAYAICLGTAALVGGSFTIAVGVWSEQLGPALSTPAMRVWFVVSAMAWCIFALQDQVLAGLKQALWVPIENTIFAVAKIGLLVLFAAPMAFAPFFRTYGILISWTIPTVALLLPVNLIIFRRVIPRHAAETADQAEPIVPAQIGKYLASNYLGALFALSTNTLLPILVTDWADSRANAYFSQPWLIAGALQFVATNMATSLTVEATSNQRLLETYSRRVLKHTARLLIPVVAIVVLAAPTILSVFGPDYATEGTTLLRLLALAALPNMIIALYISIARVRRRVAGIAVMQGAVCVLMLGLTYFLLPQHHITGVGWAWLISQTVVAVGLLLTELRWILPQRRRGEGDKVTR